MGANGRRRQTSAAIRGFKIWFGGIFLAIGLVALVVGIVVFLVSEQR